MATERHIPSRRRSNQRGWALLGASMAIVMVLTLEGAFLSRTLTQARAAQLRLQGRNGLYLGEGLVGLGMEWVRQTGLVDMGALPKYGAGNPSGWVCLDDGNPDSDSRGGALVDEVTLPPELANYRGARPTGPLGLGRPWDRQDPPAPLGASAIANCSLLVQEFDPRCNATNQDPGLVCSAAPTGVNPVGSAYYVIAQVATGPSNTVRQIRVLMQLERLAEFAYFVNGVDDATPRLASDPRHIDQADWPWFQSPTFISGPVHLNGFIPLAGQPVFELGYDPLGRPEMVTTSKGEFTYYYPGWTPYPNYDVPGFFGVPGLPVASPARDPSLGGPANPAYTNPGGGVWGATETHAGTPQDGIIPINRDALGNYVNADAWGRPVLSTSPGTPYNQPLWRDPSDRHTEPLYDTSTGPRMKVNEPKRPFPEPDVTFRLLFDRAKTGGLAFEGDVRIMIDATGGPRGDPNRPIVVMRRTDRYDSTGRLVRVFPGEQFPLPANGVLCNQGGDLTIEPSVLNGVLTLCTERDAVLRGSITYAFDPRRDPTNSNPANNDLLGLVAKKNINFLNNARIFQIGNPPPRQPLLFGVYMALNDSFGYKVTDPASILNEPDRGRALIYGALIENLPAATGIVDSSGQRHGFQLHTYFDRRIRNIALPFFPLDGAIKILSVEVLPEGGA